MEFDDSTPEDTVVQLEVLEDATFVPINITLNSTEDVLVNFSSSNATDGEHINIVLHTVHGKFVVILCSKWNSFSILYTN